jgi:sugar-specific transcriptional regulator TrmB
VWLKIAFKNWLVAAALTGLTKLICIERTKSDSMSRPDSDSNITTLHKLGLTVLEAKVYTALALAGNTEVKTLAHSLNIAKCEGYRAISALEKRGLVEKLLVVPACYRAISIDEATQILLETKSSEYNNLQKETQELVKSLCKVDATNPKLEEDDIVVSEGKTVAKRLIIQLQTAKSSFEAISTWNVCARMLCDWSKDLIRLTKSGVHVRILTDVQPKGELTPEFLSELQKNPFFEIRYYWEPLTIKLAIRDRYEVNICFSEKSSSPNIWSKNPVFAQLANKTFECMWNEAPEKLKIT